MFCTSCGREIIDTARFCNYCGKPVQNIAPPPPIYPSQNTEQPYIPTPEQNNVADQPETAESVPYYTSDTGSYNDPDMLSEKKNANPFDPDASVSEPLSSERVSETEIISQQAAAGGIFSSVSTHHDPAVYPTPGAIPKSGSGVSGSYSMPAGKTTADTLIDPAPAPAAPEKRERKYTLGHILLCLASTAIMAITAGVFAGLYFSVI